MSISPTQHPDFIASTLKNIPIRPGYATGRITLKSHTQSKQTFCNSTTLSVVLRKGCLIDVADLVVKSLPRNKKLRGCCDLVGCFKREVKFLEEVCPKLVKFQEEHQMRDRFEGVPSVIAANLTEREESVILQNCDVKSGLKFERFVGEFDGEHLVGVLRELGKFHAVSWAYCKLTGEDELKEWTGEPHISVLGNNETFNVIKKVLEGWQDCDPKLKKLIQETNNILNTKPQVTTLIHGGVTTEILFTRDKPKPKFIDWNFVRFGSPIQDISLFLFTNCFYDDLRNIEEFLREYHGQVEATLKELGLKIGDFLTFEQLKDEWKKFAKFGLLLAVFYLQIFTMNQKPDANDEEVTPEEFLEGFVKTPSQEFAWRVKDLVRFCVEGDLI